MKKSKKPRMPKKPTYEKPEEIEFKYYIPMWKDNELHLIFVSCKDLNYDEAISQIVGEEPAIEYEDYETTGSVLSKELIKSLAEKTKDFPNYTLEYYPYYYCYMLEIREQKSKEVYEKEVKKAKNKHEKAIASYKEKLKDYKQRMIEYTDTEKSRLQKELNKLG